MRILWRALPDLALPLALGLALAYLATGFVPRPAPGLRPPEELRAQGLGHAEESPARAILERNVLDLESAVLAPQGALPRPEQPPAAEVPAAPQAPATVPPLQRAPAGQEPAPASPGGSPEPAPRPGPGVGASSATEPLSGGPAVQGRIQPPAPPTAPSRPVPSPSEAPRAEPAPARPAPARPEQAQPAPAPSLAGVSLVGVIAGGARPQAMLSVDGQALSLEPGGQVRGWTLEAVEPGAVTLRSGPHVRRLGLGQGSKAP